MKKVFELPFEEPDIWSYPHLVLSNGTIKGNLKEEYYKIQCSQYINCCFKQLDGRDKFSISLADHWCIDKGLFVFQFLDLFKETYNTLNINMISMIKDWVASGNYVYGHCVVKSEKQEDLTVAYLLNGYNDNNKTMSINYIDNHNRLCRKHVGYDAFEKSLFQTSKKNILFQLLRYNKDIVIDFDMDNIIKDLEDYLKSRNSLPHLMVNKIYGVSSYDALCNYLQSEIENTSTLSVRYLQGMVDHKYLMKERMIYFLNQAFISAELVENANLIYDMSLKVRDLGLAYNKNLCKKTGEILIQELRSLIVSEKKYLLEVLENLKKTKQFSLSGVK